MPLLRINANVETWPIAGRFTISRGSKSQAVVVVATVTDGQHFGHGECVPYARYGETVEGVRDAIAALDGRLSTRVELTAALAPGAARNAVDCALWQLEARRLGTSVAALAGLEAPAPVTTCYTLSLDTPEAMAAKAASVPDLPLLKLKLGGEGDDARMAAVRAARPDARLIADANEAWTEAQLGPLLDAADRAGVELIEQPLPAGRDAALARIRRLVPVCADESAHTSEGLAALAGRYDAVNIKLDKTGGLTEALAMKARAESLGLDVMVGCMLGTSLSMAPAFLLAQGARWADIDGPLLLLRDRVPGLAYEKGRALAPPPELWG